MSNPTHKTPNRDALRQQMIQQRLQLTPQQQQRSALAIRDQLLQLPEFLSSQHLAAYWSVRGEIETTATLQQAEADGKTLYLPTLTNDNRLRFAPYQKNGPMRKNRYRIPEPAIIEDQLINADALDLVLVPLLAFDAQGNRLGMGGGFYDRTFEFKQNRAAEPHKKPLLIGFAHHFQQVKMLAAEPWDVALDLIVTNKGVINGRL